MSYDLKIHGCEPAADWTAANPTLAQFEMGVESDTGLSKVNFNSTPTAWADLGYWNPGGTTTVDNTAYNATSWDGDTTHAPSKNAVRDKIEALPAVTIAVAEAASSITPCADGVHASPTSITTAKGIITAIS